MRRNNREYVEPEYVEFDDYEVLDNEPIALADKIHHWMEFLEDHRVLYTKILVGSLFVCILMLFTSSGILTLLGILGLFILTPLTVLCNVAARISNIYFSAQDVLQDENVRHSLRQAKEYYTGDPLEGVVCEQCNIWVYEDVEYCPECGEYLYHED